MAIAYANKVGRLHSHKGNTNTRSRGKDGKSFHRTSYTKTCSIQGDLLSIPNGRARLSRRACFSFHFKANCAGAIQFPGRESAAIGFLRFSLPRN